MERRECRICNQEKDVSEFAFVKAQNTYDSYCKSCRKAYMRKYSKTYYKRPKTRQRKSVNNICYAVYRGDEFLCLGTKQECAKYMGVKENTIHFWGTPSNIKRNQGKGMLSIVVEED